MALRSDGVRTEKRILSTCVRLFLENGYHQTTMQQILNEAHVSSGSFQNLFHTKDGVLLELVKFMYGNQFSAVRGAGEQMPPVYVYAVETSIQLTLTELNERLRDIYLEAYTRPELLNFIQHATARELHSTFGPYQPELTEADFLALDYGSAGLMRGYMANPCTEEFPLEKKLSSFLTLALRGYRVPEDEVERVLALIAGMNMRALAQSVMEELFRQLSVHYDFSLSGLLPE